LKLPLKQDPSGEAECSIHRADLLDVLFVNGVSITCVTDEIARLRKGVTGRSFDLPPIVKKSVVQHVSRTFGIPIEDFYLSTPRQLNTH
jgi:hypothetical protein